MLKLVFCIGLFMTASLNANTSIQLDGKKLSVFFNDGDTFQIHNSQGKTSARLKGFNALKAYGPVHQWGKWTAEELYQISQDATEEARSGNWDCHIVGGRDKYGRILVDCPDLSKDLIEKGLAHIMFVESGDDDSTLIALQKKAIRAKVGMWKKGTPDYILTSVHSTTEKELEGKAYDRFVSTKTGRSLLRSHRNAYDACETVAYTPEEGETASSMLYVPFTERYGAKQAACLRN